MKYRPGGLVVAVLAAGVTLGACSSGSSSPTTSSTTGSGPTTTARSTTSSTGGAPTTSSGTPRCATAALTGSVVGSSGAAGTIETTVALKSTAGGPCILGGYPGLQLLGPSGSPLPTKVVRGGTYSFTTIAPTTVTLAPGQSAYFNIGYSDVPVGGQTSCPSSSSLEVTPPNAFDHLVLTVSLSPCGGGTMVVSPVFSATGPGSQTTAPTGG
jgi:hypothetical protein